MSAQKNELIASNGDATRSLQDTTDKNKVLRGEADNLINQSNELKKTIQQDEQLLKDLRSNINLFPTEIVEFVNQGSKNAGQYLGVALIPIIVIGVMFLLLVRGAADLTTVLTENPKVNITALLLSRLPYVTIATVIITASYKISKAFFDEVIKINRQRLNLTKISIIAKDVSSASERDLSLSDEDIYRLRTEAKMMLLREHLKDYIGKDSETKLPRRPFWLLPASGPAEEALEDPPKSS